MITDIAAPTPTSYDFSPTLVATVTTKSTKNVTTTQPVTFTGAAI